MRIEDIRLVRGHKEPWMYAKGLACNRATWRSRPLWNWTCQTYNLYFRCNLNIEERLEFLMSIQSKTNSMYPKAYLLSRWNRLSVGSSTKVSIVLFDLHLICLICSLSKAKRLRKMLIHLKGNLVVEKYPVNNFVTQFTMSFGSWVLAKRAFICLK
jgi:hypothetical protein